MLKLYLRTLVNRDLSVLTNIADEASDVYKKKCLKRRKKTMKEHSNYFSTSLTVLEAEGIISNIIDQHKKISTKKVLGLSIAVPLFATFQSESFMQVRTVFSALCQGLPVSDKISRICRHLNVPARYVDPAIVGFYSLFQVLSIRISHGHKSWNIIDIGKKTIALSVLYGCARRLAKKVHKTLWFIPDFVISSYIALQVAPFTQRLVRYGLRDSLEWLSEDLLHTFSFLEKELDELPPDYPVPEALTCSICSGILEEPVECLGYFFCWKCLNHWFSDGHFDHPVTREAISKDLVSHSLVLNCVARRYRMEALKAIASQ